MPSSKIDSRLRAVGNLGVALAVFLGLSTFAAGAAAQRGVDVGRFRPALDSDSFLGVQSSRTPGHGRFGFQLALDWAVDPLVFKTDPGPDVDLIDHRVTGRMQFQAGLGDRFAVGFDVPFVLYQDVNRNAVVDGLGPVASSAASNPRLLGRVRLLGRTVDGDRLPEGLGLALQLGVAPPTGSTNGFASDADWVVEAHVIGDYHLLGAGVGLQIGTRFRVDDVKEPLLGARFQHELDVGLGLKVPIPVTAGLWGILETRWIADLSGEFGFNGPTNTVEGDLGVRWRREDITLTVAVGTGFNGGVGAPAVRSFVAVAWAPKVADADGDGVPDEEDQCEFLPEDFDGFEDHDGCLDPDNDNDLIPDEDDRCPDEEAEEFRDEDEDGCTDPFVDTDRDGIGDSADACPQEAEDPDGNDDGDGCPDVDAPPEDTTNVQTDVPSAEPDGEAIEAVPDEQEPAGDPDTAAGPEPTGSTSDVPGQEAGPETGTASPDASNGDAPP